MPTPVTPTQPYKAVVAFIIAFVGALVATLQGRTDFTNMGAIDWLIVIASAVVTAGGVWATTNPPKPTTGDSGYDL